MCDLRRVRYCIEGVKGISFALGMLREYLGIRLSLFPFMKLMLQHPLSSRLGGQD